MSMGSRVPAGVAAALWLTVFWGQVALAGETVPAGYAFAARAHGIPADILYAVALTDRHGGGQRDHEEREDRAHALPGGHLPLAHVNGIDLDPGAALALLEQTPLASPAAVTAVQISWQKRRVCSLLVLP